ncbi:MAG: histidinol dehydrogenase [Legionellales bacterium]|nr:histidinol dehydrogenase [Legionellales bacterium]|tara:strand:- start:1633 stop:2922 length:1290 start_codon:yes stop_codon:yes gene_type:complete
MKYLDTSSSDFKKSLSSQIKSNSEPNDEISMVVSEIVKDIRDRGDEALLEYTNQYDRLSAQLKNLEITKSEIDTALSRISDSMRESLENAIKRIRSFHEKQKQETWTYTDEDGNTLGQRITSIERVGVYVPGGKAAYPSSVLMNVIPAQVAGVQEIIMVVPTPDGERNDLVLASAAILGVNKIFSIGGAQAIAALAFGTKLIPKVDKIVGPGNMFVAAAKRQVFGFVGIDMIAGPSEVVIIADENANADWVAMDLLAQAEHDEEASAILISPNANIIKSVEKSIEKFLPQMERAEIIQASLNNNGLIIKTKDFAQAVEIVNIIAPEHLELAVIDPEILLEDIKHAGAIFMGNYSAESIGDYCAGPNHVLPTSHTARFSSPLGVYDFQKKTSLIKCDGNSVSEIAKVASILAHGEGLTAHARSAEFRHRS